ncbi:MAG: hypothetical protein WCR42_03015 [bacterium]
MKTNEPEDSYLKQVFVTQSKGFADISKKRDFWAEIANELNGVFSISHTISQDIEIFNLKVPYEDVVIEFTESDTKPLKVYCEIESEKDISFSISIEDIFEKILKVFGQQDIKLNDPAFDKKYLVKGNDEKLTIDIINYKNVKELILKTNIFSVTCEHNKKNRKLQISSLVGRSVNSKEEMKDIYSMIKSIIEKVNIEVKG